MTDAVQAGRGVVDFPGLYPIPTGYFLGNVSGVTALPIPIAISSFPVDLDIGSSTITGGTTTRILYDNAGVLGEYTITGTGTVVAMATSPTLITPALGVATATSLAIGGATIGANGLAVTGRTALGDGLTITPATANTTALTLTGGTITAAANLFSGTRTWNNAAVTFTSMLLNITDTASNAASLFLDFQIAGASKFSVSKAGAVTGGNGTVFSVIASSGSRLDLQSASGQNLNMGSGGNTWGIDPNNVFRPLTTDNNDIGTPTNRVRSVVSAAYSTSAPNTQTGATYSIAATDSYVILNRAGTVTLTLPAAASFAGRQLTVSTIQAQTVVSAASNVVPQAGGAAGTAILAATAGKWAKLVSDATNWIIMESN